MKEIATKTTMILNEKYLMMLGVCMPTYYTSINCHNVIVNYVGHCACVLTMGKGMQEGEPERGCWGGWKSYSKLNTPVHACTCTYTCTR